MTCPRCERRPKQAHGNARWCAPCAKELRRRPKSTLGPQQRKWLCQAAGKLSVDECVQALGTSRANVKRAARDMGIKLYRARYSPTLLRQVLRYYEKHGKAATQKRFPDVRTRSIVERHPTKPRQTRWTDDELRLAAIMVGFVPFDRQADILQRPNTRAGSIRSVWQKRFKLQQPCSLHGLPQWHAKYILKPGYPVVNSPWADQRRHGKGRDGCRHTVLWCEMEPWLRDGMPDWLRDAIRALADFQRWLYADKKPRRAIEETMRIAGVA